MATQLLTRKQRGDRIAPEDIDANQSSQFFRQVPNRQIRIFRDKGRAKLGVRLPGLPVPPAVQCKHIHAVEARISKLSLDSDTALFPRALGGVEMTSCPECSSDNLEELGREDGGRQDDEHIVARTKFNAETATANLKSLSALKLKPRFWRTATKLKRRQSNELP